MQCDKGLILLLAGLMILVDVLSASRPDRSQINGILNAVRISTNDVEKTNARLTAAYLSRLSDDEDLVVDMGSGADMQNDDPGASNTDSLPEVTCCSLGKLVGSNGRTCDTRSPRGYRRKSKTRKWNRTFGTNRKQLGITQPLELNGMLSLKYNKCLLKRYGEFYKCCIAQRYLHQRKFRLRQHDNMRHRHWRGRGLQG